MRRGSIAACLGSVLTVACAGPPPPPHVSPAIEIDLSPRCLRVEATGTAPTLSPDAIPERLRRGARADGDRGVAAWLLDTPLAARESISWGFPMAGGREAAILAQALLAEGATTRDPEGFRAQVSAIAAQTTVHLEGDWLWLELAFPRAHRREAFELLSRWHDVAPVEPSTFSRLRRRVALESAAAAAAPSALAERAFDRLQLEKSGDDARSQSHTRSRDAMHDWLGGALASKRSVLLFSHIEPVREIDLASLPPRPIASEEVVSANPTSPSRTWPPQTSSTLHIVDMPGAAQVEILIGHPSVGPAHPDFAALEALASLLGQDVGGRLFRDLRERHGLAYIINAFQRPEARFIVTTRSRPERLVPLVLGIEDHLRALRETPLEACEVEMLEARLVGGEALAVDDTKRVRKRFRADIAEVGRPTTPRERARRYREAIANGLESVARRLLDGPPVIVLVGDARQIRADFAAATPERPIRVFSDDLESIHDD